MLSLMKGGRVWAIGWNKESRKVDTIGRPGYSFLSIFGSLGCLTFKRLTVFVEKKYFLLG